MGLFPGGWGDGQENFGAYAYKLAFLGPMALFWGRGEVQKHFWGLCE